jgi:hypothetical protein
MFSAIAKPIARATRDYGYADRPLFQSMFLAIVIMETKCRDVRNAYNRLTAQNHIPRTTNPSIMSM